MIMTQIIIVDYFLKIVIVIITIYIELCLYHCLQQPHAIFLDEKKVKLVLLFYSSL